MSRVVHRSYELQLTLDFFTFSAVAVATGVRCRRDIYHSTGNLAGYRMIYSTCGAPRRGGCWAGCARANLPYLFCNLPYLFSKLTLYFSTFSTTAPATSTQYRRDIYHSIELDQGYRMVYCSWRASRRGGCWAAPARANLPYLFCNLPYLFSQLTLYFLTFSSTAPATMAARRRYIYRSIENSKGYRMVYTSSGASPI